MRIRAMIVAAFVALAVVPVAAQAEDECFFSDGTAEFPTQADPAGDYRGLVLGTGEGPFGDINRESADILDVWFSVVPTTSSPKYRVNVEIASLGDPVYGSDLNETLYVVWDNPRATTTFSRQFVGASFNGRGTASYVWGDYGPDPTSGVNTFFQRGTTTGIQPAKTSPSLLTIDIPFRLRMGLPQAGDILTNVVTEAFVFVGAVYGLLYVQDDTSNAEGCLDVTF